MAATLTDSGEQTAPVSYWSFPIEKTVKTADGDLIVYGRATDGSVDSDGQIVDLDWSGKALDEWAPIGNVRVQHQAQRDPAGKAIEIVHQADSHWVKSLIVEPVAKRLVEKGVLTAYSVGIARPVIEPDVTGKARGGIIRGGTLVELSLVDRPANKNCGIQLVKSADGGEAEVVCKVWGDEEILTKDGGGGVQGTMPTPTSVDDDDLPDYDKPSPEGTAPTDPTDGGLTGKSADVRYSSVSVELPGDVSVAFSPADLAKMNTFAQELGAELAELGQVAFAEEKFLGKGHRKFSARRRKELAGGGNALPDGSYPIPDKDALRRAAILARSGHGNVSAARRLISRRAKELGVSNPLSSNDAEKSEGDVTPSPIAVEDVSKGMCSECKKPMSKCSCSTADMSKSDVEADSEKGIAQMNHDDMDTDSGEDSDSGADKSENAAVEEGSEKSSKPKKGGKGGKGGKSMPPWMKDKEKDGDSDSDDDKKSDKAAPTDGVRGMTSDPLPVHREPDGLAIESMEADAGLPTVPDSSVSGVGKSDGAGAGAEFTEMDTALRLKTVGVAYTLGALHDMCCPAFAPGDVAKGHPGASFSGIDLMFFAQKAMDAASVATGATMQEAARASRLWTHAQTLKSLTDADALELQTEAHKAFRDANPGVGSAPTPGHISAGSFKRPAITAGHAADSPGHDGPHTATIPPEGGIHAESFGRGFISEGHAADSPANKGVGVPTSVDYVPTIRENARAAMRAMHDHVAQTFPDVCPMEMSGDERTVMSRPVPVPGGTPATQAARIGQVGKSEDGVDVTVGKETEHPTDVMKGLVDADVEKAAKKMRRKLGKKVLSGKMTVDEARAQIGRRIAQKAGGQTMISSPSMGGGGMKSETEAAPVVPEVVKSIGYAAPSPINVYPSAPAPATAVIDADVVKSAVEAAVAPLLEKMAADREAFQERIAALEGMPDPNVTAFRGMAYASKSMSARPAGANMDELRGRTQAMMLSQAEQEWRSADNPIQREAAWASMMELRGFKK